MSTQERPLPAYLVAEIEARIAYTELPWQVRLTTAPPPGWPGGNLARVLAWGADRYGLGAFAALLSSIVHRTQHEYYRAARDRLRRVETLFDVPSEARVDTTGALGGRRVRLKVTVVVHLLLAAMLVAQVVGAVAVLWSG